MNFDEFVKEMQEGISARMVRKCNGGRISKSEIK